MVTNVTSALRVPQAPRRYESVVDAILELVEARGLRPGQALPPERELAEVFGVSRNVIRQSVGILEERGLLHTIRGSGRYLRRSAGGHDGDEPVASRTSMEMASIADVLEARCLLEVEVAALACQRRTAQQAENILVLARRLNSWEDNLKFHCAIAAATQNFSLEHLIREQAELAGELNQRRHYEHPDQLDRMRSEHVHIASAIARRDVGGARELVRQHLSRTRDVFVSEPQMDRDSQQQTEMGERTKAGSPSLSTLGETSGES